MLLKFYLSIAIGTNINKWFVVEVQNSIPPNMLKSLSSCRTVYFSRAGSYVMKPYRMDDPWIRVIASEIKSICSSSVTHKF